jgi:hypothetical protein
VNKRNSSVRFGNTLSVLHVSSAVGWLGALAVFGAHAVASLASYDEAVARAASIAMEIAAWWVILPLAIAALFTGILQAIASPWGLLRHYWVVFKLGLTVVATAVLLAKLGPIHDLALAARLPEFASTAAARLSLVIHAIGGMALLAVVVVLAMVKPAGVLRGGLMPGWARVGIAFAAFVGAILAVMLMASGHGPHMHS